MSSIAETSGIDVPPEVDLEEVILILSKIDFSKLDEGLKKQMVEKSFGWAMNDFKRRFLEAEGDVDRIEDPLRVVLLENPASFLEEVRNLRGLKREIKELEASLEQGEDSLSEAKRIVLGMYRRLVNLKIARRYPLAASLTNKRELSPVEREILNSFRFSLRDDTSGLKPDSVGRVIERIDHFLQGAGLQLGPNGLFVSYPAELEEYALSLLDQEKLTSPDWELAQSVWVSPEQVKIIVDLALKLGGFAGWSAEVASVRCGLKCSSKSR